MAATEENTPTLPTEERHHHRRPRRTHRSCWRTPLSPSPPYAAPYRRSRPGTASPDDEITHLLHRRSSPSQQQCQNSTNTRRIWASTRRIWTMAAAAVALDHGSGSVVVRLVGACATLGRRLGSGGWSMSEGDEDGRVT
ncbi:hypothetical protein Dimus_022264 [Dionaea muscipula]